MLTRAGRPSSTSAAPRGSATSTCRTWARRRGRSARRSRRVEADAHAHLGAAALGGDYARLRTDCRLVGRGATGDLLGRLLRRGRPDARLPHVPGPRARPTPPVNLLFKGAVGGHSPLASTPASSGCGRTLAAPTPSRPTATSSCPSDAWAESVPNLEIENNDVRCSHASTVGPIDEEQRFYLESRGVPPPSPSGSSSPASSTRCSRSCPSPALADRAARPRSPPSSTGRCAA